MRSERKKQIMTLSILVVSILVISVGFAAFSSTLRINSSASVNPNASDFSVKFSTTKDTLTVAEVAPTAKTEGITATNGKIDNLTSPTISNLSAEFIKPGDYVEYTFYARNEGQYKAFLNNINFKGEKVCASTAGATAALVNAACESIVMTVSVAGEDYTETTEITGHELTTTNGEEIKVRIEYLSTGSLADGAFTVTLPEITMIYSSVDKPTFRPGEGCTVKYQDSSKYSVGDEVTCTIDGATEKFYIIENAYMDASTVKMLTEKNVSTTTYRQSSDAGTVKFAETYYTDLATEENIYPYWQDDNGSLLPQYQLINSPTEYDSSYTYSDVYDANNTTIKPIVDNYVSYLNTLFTDATGTLLTYGQAIALGCTFDGDISGNCSAAPSWVASTPTYWLASSHRGIDRVFHSGMWHSDCGSQYEVRPVITVSTTYLQ